jgi:Ca-activated chloride channel family protein
MEKSEIGSMVFTDFDTQYQWFIGFGLLFLIVEFFISERKSLWLEKLNLFNERKK